MDKEYIKTIISPFYGLFEFIKRCEYCDEYNNDYNLCAFFHKKQKRNYKKNSIYDQKWNKMYELLKVYYQKNGTFDVENGFKTLDGESYDESGYNLYEWLNYQKTNKFIFPDRRKKLIELGINVSNNNFSDLIEIVNQDFNSLTEEQIKESTRLILKKFNDLWDIMFPLMKQYYNKYGYNFVPRLFKTNNGIDYDETGRNLYSWYNFVGKVRFLNYMQRTQLDSLKFKYQNDEWNYYFSFAKIYYENYGNLTIPMDFKTNNGIDYDETGINLGVWVAIQHDNNNLSLDKRNKLKSIGFIIFTEKNDEEIMKICRKNSISYSINQDVLRHKSYLEIQTRIDYLLEFGIPIVLENGRLNDIFNMTIKEIFNLYGITIEPLFEINNDKQLKRRINMNYKDVKTNFYTYFGLMRGENTPLDYRQNINKIIEFLLDINKSRCDYLDENETIFLRNKVGVFKYYNQEEPKLDLKSVDKCIINQKIRHIISYGFNFKLEKMSSFDLERLNDISITDLKISDTIKRNLLRNNIFTVRELLSYSLSDLLRIRNFGQKAINLIYEAVHSLNLRFIDELLPIEKSFIILKSTEKEINNSSIYWIDGLDVRKIIGDYKIGKISDIRDYIKSGNQIPFYLINYANSLGIDLSYICTSDEFIGKDYDKLLDIDLKDLSLSTYILIKLENYGIKKIRDLINIPFINLHEIFEHDFKDNEFVDNIIEKIIVVIHNLGLMFVDEAKELNAISDSVRKRLKI